MSTQHEDLWTVVRLAAEGSDWKRDEGETLSAWAQRTLLKRSADVSRQDWEEIPHPDGASDGAAFIVSTGDEPVFCVSVDGKWYRFRMPPIPGALRITLENGTGIETTGYVSDNSPGKDQP